jgi:hypothetical protein
MQTNIGAEEIIATKPLLNLALTEDALEDGYVCISSMAARRYRTKQWQILSISIYVASGVKSIESLGKRVTIHRNGIPSFETILQEERDGRYVNRVQEESWKQEDMAVLSETTPLLLVTI